MLCFHEATFCRQNYSLRSDSLIMAGGNYADAVRKNAACPLTGEESANGESYFLLSFPLHRRADAQLGREGNRCLNQSQQIKKNWSERMNGKNI